MSIKRFKTITICSQKLTKIGLEKGSKQAENVPKALPTGLSWTHTRPSLGSKREAQPTQLEARLTSPIKGLRHHMLQPIGGRLQVTVAGFKLLKTGLVGGILITAKQGIEANCASGFWVQT